MFCSAAKRCKANNFVVELKNKTKNHIIFPITSMKGGKMSTIYVLAPGHREFMYQMENWSNEHYMNKNVSGKVTVT